VNAGRIDKNDLPISACDNALYAMTRRLRLVGNSRYLFTDEPIKQRRLTGIRSPDQADITAAEFWLFHSQLLCTNVASFNNFCCHP
jgi:hypothetical protein